MKSEKLKNIYPMTPMQEGMLFHTLKDNADSPGTYLEQCLISLEGGIGPDVIERSFQMLVERYDIFRSIFLFESVKQPMHVVMKQRNFKLAVEDLSGLNLAEEDRRPYLETFIDTDCRKGFDLSRDLLMRATLFKFSESSWFLLWSYHHILMDGWSLSIVFGDLIRICRGLKERGVQDLDDPVPYNDYILWLKGQSKAEGLKFWNAYLEGFEQPSLLPRAWQRRSEEMTGYKEVRYRFFLDETLTNGLKSLAASLDVTVNDCVQTLWGLLLQRYNNTDDVVFGVVVSGRPPELEGAEQLVGLFINTVPLRIKTAGPLGFNRLVKDTRMLSAASSAFHYVSLAEIQAEFPLKGELIHHIMVFENYPVEEVIGMINLEGSESGGDSPFTVTNVELMESTNYDFNIIVTPGDRYKVTFSFNAMAYEEDYINQAAHHFTRLTEQVVTEPSVSIDKPELLRETEKQNLLRRFNDTSLTVPSTKSIHQLFEEQVEKEPDRIAVVGLEHGAEAEDHHVLIKDNNSNLSYRELNKKSNQLAHVLINKGLKPNTIAAIMGERSIETVIGILGILKAGAAYLPIDPGLPEKRVDFMLKDSGASVVLGTSSALTEQRSAPPSHLPTFPLSNPSSLAYIIYTSGSTGTPKGVMIEHSSLVNLCAWHNRYFSITPDDHASCYANFGFDASVWEMFPYLIIGSSLHIVPEDIKYDMHALKSFFQIHDVTIGFLPTPVCEQFMFMETHNRSLRFLLTGGDRLRDYSTQPYRVVNNYGPTENSVVTTSFVIDGEAHPIPIGKPIANNQVYILDRNGRIQPVGVPGELCIGGSGLARGYLNRPELSNEKFLGVQNPFFKRGFGRRRQYKTGDLACWLSD
ncbi:MAG: AMP-binding protein, partial [bacterium]|nr:AMP-binding protein [bacterium]